MAFGDSIFNQVTELRRKIQLLEVERTASYERTEAAVKRNKETIQELRKENKGLRKKLAKANSECNEELTRVAFQKDWERKAYRNKSVKEVTEKLEESVLSKRKSLNARRHTTETYQRRLKEMKMEYQRLKSERSCSDMSTDAYTLKIEDDAMNLRALENKLEKSQFKCREAESIMANYLKLKTHLQNESLTYQGQLDCLEEEILKHREELHSLQVMSNDQLSKEASKAQLQQEEELLHKECKERESVIAGYRIKIREYKAQDDKVDRRVQRTAVQPDELSSEAQHSTTKTEDEEKKISTFEEAFKRVKDAIGITDLQEIVERFNSQKETSQKLEKMKEENEEILLQLKEEKELLSQLFEEMKNSREAKLSSNQKALQESEQQLQTRKQRCDATKEQLDWLLKTLSTAQDGIEHLADKLQHISLGEDTVPEVHPDSDHFVLELVTQCEKKLEALDKDVQGKELDKEELCIRTNEKLPEYSPRVKLSEADDPFLDETESEEDEAEVISREALKRQSQLIIDSHFKRKATNRKKTKKDKF